MESHVAQRAIKPQETAEGFLKNELGRLSSRVNWRPPSGAHVVLKEAVSGDFLVGPVELIKFSCIQDCISNNVQPILSIEIDPFTGRDNVLFVPPDERHEIKCSISNRRHDEISIKNTDWQDMTVISSFDIKRAITFGILNIENIQKLPEGIDVTKVAVTCDIYAGRTMLSQPWQSSAKRIKNTIFNENRSINIELQNVPRESILVFKVLSIRSGRPERTIWVGQCPMFKYNNELITGIQRVSLWPADKFTEVGADVEVDMCLPKNDVSRKAPVLLVQMPVYSNPVVFTKTSNVMETRTCALTSNEEKEINRIIRTDPLYELSTPEKQLLWRSKSILVFRPKALPKFIQAVPKGEKQAKTLLHSLITKWAQISISDALQLLTFKYQDPYVRAHAIKNLERLNNEELLDYLLPLVTALKYELYHDSPLAQFLLTRALQDKKIGHRFFWHLKADMHDALVATRYKLLLDAFLRGCGPARASYYMQDEMQRLFIGLANTVIKEPEQKNRTPLLRDLLAKTQLPSKFQYPLDPSVWMSSLNVRKCKVMNSKKAPLWLDLNNSFSKNTEKYMFKSGDDLRQDMITLQLLRIMDKVSIDNTEPSFINSLNLVALEICWHGPLPYFL